MDKFLALGEILIRFTPKENNTYFNGNIMEYYYGGSEANIVTMLSGLGIDSYILSAIPDNDLCKDVEGYFKGMGVNTEKVIRKGEKMGMYFSERGTGIRASSVIYDRKHSSFSQLEKKDIDFNSILEGITWFHFSGITAAVSENVREVLKELICEAKARGITISMDLNYRSKMWGVKEAKDFLSEIAPNVDICFGIEPIKASENDYDLFSREKSSIQDIEERMKAIKELYDFKYIFHTERENDTQDNNSYHAYAYSDKLYDSITLKTRMIERIGSGDAFVAGIIYSLMKKYSLQEAINFGVGAATLKCTIKGDQMHVSEENIKSIADMKIEINR